MKKILWRLALSAVIAGLLLWWLASQGFDVIPSYEAVRETVALEAIGVYVALFFCFHFLRAWRWSYLLAPVAKVDKRLMLETALAGFAAIQMMPLRTGEVARPYLLDRYAGISKSALFGTIAIERVIDGLIVSLLLTIALFTIPAHAGPYVWVLRLVPSSIFIAATILLVAFHRNPDLVSRILGKILGLVSKRLADFAIGVISRFHQGLAALPHMRSFWMFTLTTCLYWGINAYAFYLLAGACGLSLPFAGAIAGMGVLAVGILLPAGPGYFGNFQIATLVALEMYIPNASEAEGAAVFVFVLYCLQTGLTLLLGGAGGFALHRRPIASKTGASSSNP